MPVRDQGFVIDVIETGDVFKSVREDVQRVKQESAEGTDKPQSVWVQVPDDPLVTPDTESDSTLLQRPLMVATASGVNNLY
jgi:hypothetical protein